MPSVIQKSAPSLGKGWVSMHQVGVCLADTSWCYSISVQHPTHGIDHAGVQVSR